jgi:16S rRNA processing protein RimM
VSGAWVPFAVVVRAHGVRGELTIKLLDNSGEWPDFAEKLQVVPKSGPAFFVSVSQVRPTNRGYLLFVDEIADRDAAQRLAGALLQVESAAIPAPMKGEFYFFELQGAQVVGEAGEPLGRVEGFLQLPQQTAMEIRGEAGSGLLPATPEYIVKFDRTQHKVTVRNYEGLWETHRPPSSPSS